MSPAPTSSGSNGWSGRAEERDAKKGAGDRVAAEDRNRVGMPPVALRLRQEAAPAGQLPDERSQRDRKREASEKRQQGGCCVHEIRRSPDVRKSSGTGWLAGPLQLSENTPKIP